MKHNYRARIASLWRPLALETVAIATLIAGVWWFVERYEAGGPVARMLVDPGVWLAVIIASVLGALGNLGLYYLGQRGTDAVFERFPGLEDERWERIGGFYQRHGARLLILSALPGLGTFLSTGAGAFGIKRGAFLLWIILAKTLRNWVLLLFFHQFYRLLGG